MALLQPRRILSDEGFLGTLCFVKTLRNNSDARKRVLQMRKTFNTHESVSTPWQSWQRSQSVRKLERYLGAVAHYGQQDC